MARTLPDRDRTRMRRRVAALAGALCAALLAVGARAAEWQPSRPVRIVVAYAPGGTTDLMARLLANGLAPRLGQPVLVENRPGGGAVIGTEFVARAPADGHTLLMATNGSHGINSGLFPNLSYDPVRDFVPVMRVATVPLVLIVPRTAPARSVADLVGAVRAAGTGASYGSAGVGSSGHIAAELLKRLAGLSMEHVPYRGDSSVLPDLMSGRLTLMFGNLPGVLEQVRAGTVRALAVTGARRAAALPEVPTVEEAGLGGFDVDPWYGLVAPAGTPAEAVARLHREAAAILREPETGRQMAILGAQPDGGTPDAFGAIIRADVERYTGIIRQAGIRPD